MVKCSGTSSNGLFAMTPCAYITQTMMFCCLNVGAASVVTGSPYRRRGNPPQCPAMVDILPASQQPDFPQLMDAILVKTQQAMEVASIAASEAMWLLSTAEQQAGAAGCAGGPRLTERSCLAAEAAMESAENALGVAMQMLQHTQQLVLARQQHGRATPAAVLQAGVPHHPMPAQLAMQFLQQVGEPPICLVGSFPQRRRVRKVPPPAATPRVGGLLPLLDGRQSRFSCSGPPRRHDVWNQCDAESSSHSLLEVPVSAPGEGRRPSPPGWSSCPFSLRNWSTFRPAKGRERKEGTPIPQSLHPCKLMA